MRLGSKSSLVALGSAAVLAVYAAGYAHTAPAARRLKLLATAIQRGNAPAQRLKDGTYAGWGSCRHGDLEVTVVIEQGRIIDATISRCLTRYSKNVIARLPPQVVARQKADVDLVSRATESSEAFFTAVTKALIAAAQ